MKLIDIAEVRPLPDHKIWLRFEDGVSGTFDFKNEVGFVGVFSALADEGEFAKASVHPEIKVVCWPNGADLDTAVLYARVTGKPITLPGYSNE